MKQVQINFNQSSYKVEEEAFAKGVFTKRVWDFENEIAERVTINTFKVSKEIADKLQSIAEYNAIGEKIKRSITIIK